MIRIYFFGGNFIAKKIIFFNFSHFSSL